jgi:hypothetical protein
MGPYSKLRQKEPLTLINVILNIKVIYSKKRLDIKHIKLILKYALERLDFLQGGNHKENFQAR